MATTATVGGAKLKQARTDAGISQTALGLRSGISQPYISEMERGEKPLSVYAATCVELALDLKPRALVRHAEDMPATLASLIPGYLNARAIVCRLTRIVPPTTPALSAA